ncbi:glycosyltransferase family 52 [Marivirga sp.]|uniref:glycosyltransferase family 52 n=1 Tax=Marivirga sp. TaxID=2018662 RepID=UPI003DA76C07
MNIFFVSSPLQLINATEARYFYKIEANSSLLIILDFYGKNNKEQVFNVLKNFEWPNKMIFSYVPSKNRFKLLFKIKEVINSLRLKTYDKLFIGDYYAYEIRAVVNKIRFDELCIFDDGNASILVLENLQKGIKEKFGIRYFLYKSFGLNVNQLKKFRLFSAYSHTVNSDTNPNIVIDKNNYSLLKSSVPAKSKADEIIILGVKFVEANFVTFDEYVFKLKAMISDLKKRFNGEVVYIPHRHEDKNKVISLQEILGLKIRDVNYSIEIYLINEDFPQVVATFFSSALFNLNLIFGHEIPLISYYIDINVDIPSSYSEYRKLGIEVVDAY